MSSLSGGKASFETVRSLAIPGFVSDTLAASPDITFVTLRAGLAHEMLRERWYLRTSLDVGANHMKFFGFTESGTTPMALDIPASSDTYVSVYPSLEIGGVLDRSHRKTKWRPFARVGYMGLGLGGAPGLEASFVGAPDEVTTFMFESGLERDYAELALGIDILSSKTNLVRLEANGLFGDATTQYGIEGSWSIFFR